MTTQPIRQVQSRHIERHAAEAIADRVGHDVADAVIGSTRKGWDCDPAHQLGWKRSCGRVSIAFTGIPG